MHSLGRPLFSVTRTLHTLKRAAAIKKKRETAANPSSGIKHRISNFRVIVYGLLFSLCWLQPLFSPRLWLIWDKLLMSLLAINVFTFFSLVSDSCTGLEFSKLMTSSVRVRSLVANSRVSSKFAVDQNFSNRPAFSWRGFKFSCETRQRSLSGCWVSLGELRFYCLQLCSQKVCTQETVRWVLYRFCWWCQA